MKKQVVITVLFTLFIGRIWAQSAYQVTDSQPVTLNGLTMGYKIKSEEVKAVGDKGDFSRFSVSFYVTNPTSEEKIILYKQGWNVLNNVSDQLAKFNIINATGARLTSKEALISAAPCNVLAYVEDKDCATNKITKTKRFVQIGYSIKAGQTFSSTAILIVPLNQKPNVEVTSLANQLQPTGSASYPGPPPGYDPNQPPPTGRVNPDDFIKIRNAATNTYVNVEIGAPRASAIDAGWWSAQWSLIRLPGARIYVIKSRWKDNQYLSTDTGSPGTFVNYVSDGARWVIEPVFGTNTVRIKNLGTGSFLGISQDKLSMTNNANQGSLEWVFEAP
ncbi:RICIN domain-containing protein [Mucilaginibacter gilvus]|uniref:Uncharacterized protein n=1 Tax=Mucilaginibacter gilvus TaxID=2305909 RepID=A0A444MR30_9SPHI|nr:hypothetical protein [Mucilaginibacter gilvus]RWY54063.1 hypothetical protein EPL05_08435 [Mucilaginibacter gilvus]